MTTTDLIIIGSGPGGYRTAEYAAKQGLKVTIFESKHAGGTCLNVGCIPTKTFVKNAEVMEELREAATFGISADSISASIDMEKVVERKQQVISQLRQGVEMLLSHPNISLVRATAKLIGNKTVLAEETGETYSAENIIIATGSSSKLPPIPLEEGAFCDSEKLLDITHVPETLCIVGAGVIGMEFASVFHAFGSQVTVIEFQKECLPTVDSDIAKRLRKSLEKRGVNFFMQAAVTQISKNGNLSVVSFEQKGKAQSIEAQEVLVAVGRKPTLPVMENCTINYDSRRGIEVDENMQTNVEGVYAIGDVNGKQMLAHAATMQGIRAVNHILNKKDRLKLHIMPSAVFTYPEVACVGAKDNELKAAGIAFKTLKGLYRANGKALAMNETEGLVKLVVDEENRIRGCHIIGAHASDLVQEVAVLMNFDATLDDLHDIVHTHPTLSEILQDLTYH